MANGTMGLLFWPGRREHRSLYDDHHPADARQEQANANAAVDAFPAAPGPISAFVPAKGWSLSLPQELVADIMVRAVREVRAESGVSAAARTVARLSRACPDFYAAAPAGWAAAAEGYDGNDGEVPSSMLVDPRSHSLPALRAACAAVAVPATTTLSKAQAIMALLGAHGLAAPLRAPVPSGLIRRVVSNEERACPHRLLAVFGLVCEEPGCYNPPAGKCPNRMCGFDCPGCVRGEHEDEDFALPGVDMDNARYDRQIDWELAFKPQRRRGLVCAAAGCNNTPSRKCSNSMCRLHCPGCQWDRHGSR